MRGLGGAAMSVGLGVDRLLLGWTQACHGRWPTAAGAGGAGAAGDDDGLGEELCERSV